MEILERERERLRCDPTEEGGEDIKWNWVVLARMVVCCIVGIVFNA